MAKAPAPSGSNYSYAQLRKLWINAGGSKAWSYVMAAVAMAESSGNPHAHHVDSDGSVDWGLWQINSVHFRGNVNATTMQNPQDNAKAAVSVFNSSGPDAWSTYKSGAYKKYMPSKKAAPTEPTEGQFVTSIEKEIGQPYVWGGTGGIGFDCSGLVYASLKAIGINTVPRTSEEQWAWVKKISYRNLEPGDLVFMNYPGETSPGHEAVYLGNDEIEQAPGTGQKVQVDKFTPKKAGTKELGGTIVGYGRVPGLDYSKGVMQTVTPGERGGAPIPAPGTPGGAPAGNKGVVNSVTSSISGAFSGIEALMYQGFFIIIGLGLILVGLGLIAWQLMGKVGAPGIVGMAQTQMRINQAGQRTIETSRAAQVRESQASERIALNRESGGRAERRLRVSEQNLGRRSERYVVKDKPNQVVRKKEGQRVSGARRSA